MTEEKKIKKIIEYIKCDLDFEKYLNGYCVNVRIDHLDKIFNFIEKLQKENERQQDIIIEKDRQLHLMHKEIQSVREQAWEITDKSLKDILMLNTPKIIIESKEDIKGLLDNYISKGKIREKIEKIEDEIKIDKELCEKLWYVCEVKDIDIKRHEVKILQELLEEE